VLNPQLISTVTFYFKRRKILFSLEVIILLAWIWISLKEAAIFYWLHYEDFLHDIPVCYLNGTAPLHTPTKRLFSPRLPHSKIFKEQQLDYFYNLNYNIIIFYLIVLKLFDNPLTPNNFDLVYID
jgi:hypothetical protein